ncbi:REP-associated tyrosine transposase [Jeotgalibacillus sp. JSM ZJ347]|uniref:REP-associated tyrosine transposase n=1 Tax=Jeotgalibacillus sp. JSM ZJ347 TaxID=3342117 RepID=UPI0035A833DF
MPRQPRQKSRSGIYHVTVRGNNHQLIFYEDADRYFLLKKILKVKDECGFDVYAWCLMDNHIHLVVREKNISISKIMQRINGSYSIYMNKKHNGSGHIYQGRFYSDPVNTISKLHNVIRYIHQNPVRSHMTSHPAGYKWSSCRAYYKQRALYPRLTDTKGVLKYFSPDPQKAIRQFAEYTETVYDLPQKKISVKPVLTDTQALALIQEHYPSINISQIKHLPVQERNQIIHELKNQFNAGQLARVIGCR